MTSALILQLSSSSTDEPAISVQSAVLLIAVAVLAFLVKEVVSLRRRLSALEGQSVSPKASAPVSAGASLPAMPLASPSATGTEAIAPEIVAAISAAIHLTVGSRARILAISAPPLEHVQAWSTEGRRQVFQSHRVR